MLKPKSDIIAASPIVTEGGCLPYRTVIRDLGHEFVVRTQVLLGSAATASFRAITSRRTVEGPASVHEAGDPRTARV